MDKETAANEKAFQDQAEDYKTYVANKKQIAKTEKQIDEERMAAVVNTAGEIGTALTDLSALSQKKGQDDKELAVAGAIISTLAGAVGAFMQASKTYPAPYGEILGAATAAAVLIEGYAQVQKIEEVQIPGGGSGSSPASLPTPSNFAPPQIPQQVQSTNLSQQSLDQLNQANSVNQLQVTVLESDITRTQANVASFRNAARVGVVPR